MKHSNVALFVPHVGCPNQCAFCNQHEITGSDDVITKKDVALAAETAMNSKGYTADSEIAFFGGSFTGIDPIYMVDLLSAAYDYVSKGLFKGIRISTRPDYINKPILETLKKYGVTSIELGAQSMDDYVLESNRRGHSAEDVVKASELIRENGFSLGLQMMTGLYRSSETSDIYTAKQIALLKPATVRIYPTIVVKDTDLAVYCLQRKYDPQTLEEAVDLCARLIDFFENMNIKVIRVGLHDSPSLKKTYISGPYHPAFGELCASRQFAYRILKHIDRLENKSPKNRYQIQVSPNYMSKAVGQKRSNLEFFKKKGFAITLKQNQEINDESFIIDPIE